LVPALVLVLSVLTIAAVVALERRAEASSDAKADLVAVDGALTRLQRDPFGAMAVLGGSRAAAYASVETDQQSITDTLARLREGDPPPALAELTVPLRENFAAIDALLPVVSSRAFTTKLDPRFYGPLRASTDTAATAHRLLAAAGGEYGARANRTQAQATAGAAAMILLLFAAFSLAYRRALGARSIAGRLAAENAELAAAASHEARTDALTGLGNRRALGDDLAGELKPGGHPDGVLLAHFDLDGFKHYNDTFGHPAGDELLTRLGQRLATAVEGAGSAYRMGGDEFSVLVHVTPGEDAAIVALAAQALSEAGDAFEINCSYGAVRIPREAITAEAALHLADRRMFEHKASWAPAGRQNSDVLPKVLSERNADLADHVSSVAELAMGVARQLALPGPEVTRIGIAAELHDVGKAAIPDAILDKPGPLDHGERKFIRQHTLIGERIMLVAPTLAATAELVRSSHEAFDGSGYPDGLLAEAIPLGARIIAVCDAFDAMTTTRSYRAAMAPKEAYAELRRCSGSQFDPTVVAAFCSLGLHDGAPPERRFARSR
jgi:diguanylate cyclase (GGDEF)-like protein